MARATLAPKRSSRWTMCSPNWVPSQWKRQIWALILQRHLWMLPIWRNACWIWQWMLSNVYHFWENGASHPFNGFLQMMKPWPAEGFVLARALWLRMMLLEVAAVEACSRRMEKVRLGSFRQEENTFKRHNSGGTMIVYARCTRRICI